MTGRNGYLYGRGVTDDKGPIIAIACAAADLLSRRALGCDLVFLIEGEEECGSIGFRETVGRYKVRGSLSRFLYLFEVWLICSLCIKDAIGDIDAILVSNSTWIGEDKPCITYGLRGVVHCGLEVCIFLYVPLTSAYFRVGHQDIQQASGPSFRSRGWRCCRADVRYVRSQNSPIALERFT